MSYNSRSPAVKRLMKEAQELAEPTELYYAEPLEDNLFEWHFTIRGPEDTDFQGGIYHGRILLPSEYPMKPPNILLLTPNGRFEIKRKICLSISGYHPESWRPCWSIRTALLAIIGFMPTHGGGAIGSLEFSSEERKKLAKTSPDFVCPDCGPTKSILLPQTEASMKDREEAKTLAKQIDFQGLRQSVESEKQKGSSQAAAPSSAPAAPAAAAAAAPAATTSAAAAAPAATTSAAAAAMPAAPFMPWAAYPWPVFAAPPGLPPQLPGVAPLSFEQWLLQVKGYQTPAAKPAPPAAQATPPAAQASSPAAQSTPPAVEPETPAAVPPPPASVEEAEEAAPPVETELRQRAPAAEEEEETRAAPDDVPEVDEWPMLSLFVICFLLVVVLLVNRFVLPHLYALFSE